MQAALQDFLGKRPGFDSIHLFGYSGGGVLAALLAARVPNTRRLVTVAAPLDLDGWIRLHGYSPLGKTDDVVPGYLIRRFVDRQGAARFVEVPGFDHRCCWAKHWASLAVMR
jgi:pimeloyl-ACP methyl ester carboxylesterase